MACQLFMWKTSWHVHLKIHPLQCWEREREGGGGGLSHVFDWTLFLAWRKKGSTCQISAYSKWLQKSCQNLYSLHLTCLDAFNPGSLVGDWEVCTEANLSYSVSTRLFCLNYMAWMELMDLKLDLSLNPGLDLLLKDNKVGIEQIVGARD